MQNCVRISSAKTAWTSSLYTLNMATTLLGCFRFAAVGASLRTVSGHVRLQTQLVGRIVSRWQSTTSSTITADEWWRNHKRVRVLEGEMAYHDSDPKDERSSRAVVFMHGNPTSSYLWRNIIPYVEPLARCLAPDLIGMGRSSKLADPGSYRYVSHYEYVSEWLEKVGLPQKFSIVCHDWGSALSFRWCSEHEARVESLTHMESIVAPVPGWENFPEIAQEEFKELRSQAGEQMILQENAFVERLVPMGIVRKLEDVEMEAYREPFPEPGEGRRPILTFAREIPIAGDGPEDVIAIAKKYHEWLSTSGKVPKLYIDAEPGVFSPGVMQVCGKWPNHRVIGPVRGLHYMQEDSPHEIGVAVRDFLLDIFKD